MQSVLVIGEWMNGDYAFHLYYTVRCSDLSQLDALLSLSLAMLVWSDRVIDLSQRLSLQIPLILLQLILQHTDLGLGDGSTTDCSRRPSGTAVCRAQLGTH